MKRISISALCGMADIDTREVAKEAGVTYFPLFEYRERIAYSCRRERWSGTLRRGCASGLLYADTNSANDTDTAGRYARDLAARETAVLEKLERVEVLQSRRDTGRAVVKFVASDGSGFTASCADDGRNWTICG